MTHNQLTWMFLSDFDVETEHQVAARRLTLEHGLTPVTAGVGAQMAFVAAAANARNIVEIGTGCGLSGLWLLAGAPEATLTSIDSEFSYHEAAREIFTAAGFPTSKVRLITGKALDVLPRMNEGSYDLVVVDGNPEELLENLEHALRLVRLGGSVLVPHALWNGDVANPANRTPIVSNFRVVLTEVATSPAVIAALSPAGDGLLQLTKVA
jgi:predicted O-methyltransferase YrrM